MDVASGASGNIDIGLEEGELSESSDENVYIPLQRPISSNKSVDSHAKAIGSENDVSLITTNKMQSTLPDDFSRPDLTSSSGSSSSSESCSDTCLKNLSAESTDIQSQKKRRKGLRRSVMVRVQSDESQEKRSRFKKYNIWMSALHEELTENMRSCDVTHGNYNDRNVENYDFTLRSRLNGETSLKRRLSNSTDDLSDSDMYSACKRECRSTTSIHGLIDGPRPAKSRLAHRHRLSTSSGSVNAFDTRQILDLNDTTGRDKDDVAREIANKLYEDKDQLLVRVVEILGTELPIEIYKETQRIEATGGMMIKNGTRRRTPGGVFLYLLKNSESLTAEEHKSIFNEEQQITNKRRKYVKAISRDRKVEELKKRLSEQETVLPVISTRKDIFLLGSNLNLENQKSSLSNPPPSPVGQEQEYKPQALDITSDKPSTSFAALGTLESPSKNLINYNDDFLDVNCGDMDFL